MFAEHIYACIWLSYPILWRGLCMAEIPIGLILGHTMRPPIKLQSRSPSMLLVSWVKNPLAVSDGHNITLYQTEVGSYSTLSADTTTNNHYRFRYLDSCSRYVACVEIAGTLSFTCLSIITGRVWRWDGYANIHKGKFWRCHLVRWRWMEFWLCSPYTEFHSPSPYSGKMIYTNVCTCFPTNCREHQVSAVDWLIGLEDIKILYCQDI